MAGQGRASGRISGTEPEYGGQDSRQGASTQKNFQRMRMEARSGKLTQGPNPKDCVYGMETTKEGGQRAKDVDMLKGAERPGTPVNNPNSTGGPFHQQQGSLPSPVGRQPGLSINIGMGK